MVRSAILLQHSPLLQPLVEALVLRTQVGGWGRVVFEFELKFKWQSRWSRRWCWAHRWVVGAGRRLAFEFKLCSRSSRR